MSASDRNETHAAVNADNNKEKKLKKKSKSKSDDRELARLQTELVK